MRLLTLAALGAAMLGFTFADDGLDRCQERFSLETCFLALQR